MLATPLATRPVRPDSDMYTMSVAVIVRVRPDGLNTHVDEYFDRVLDPLYKQEPTRR